MDRASRLLLAVFFAYALARLVFEGAPQLSTQAFDDACYFAKIGENLVRGHGFTFDRLTPTNGFQPLWQLLVVPAQALPLGAEQRFAAGLYLQWGILVAASLLLFATLARLAPRVPLVGIAALYAVWVAHESLNGMETAIQVGTLALLLAVGWRWTTAAPGRLRPSLELGATLGLVVLARLDGIFLAFALAAVLVGAAPRAGGLPALRRLAWVAAGAAVVLAPYLAWNKLEFGAFVPVSGVIKSSFPHLAPLESPFAKFGVRGVCFLLLGAGYATAYLAGLRREPTRDADSRFLRAATFAGAAGMLLHAADSYLFMRWAAFRWHYVWYGLVACLILTEAMRGLAGARRAPAFARLARPASLAACLAAAAMLVRADAAPRRYDWHAASYDAARWARQHLPAGSVLAMSDAGEFSYFSGLRVINLDGVVNTLGYQDTIRDQRWAQYLADHGVQYVVKHDFGHVAYDDGADIHRYDRVAYRVLSHRYGVWSDPIGLFRRDEVFRSAEYTSAGQPMVAAIWKWDGHAP